MSLLLHKKWYSRLHSAGVAGTATVHFSIYAIFLVSWIWSFYTNGQRCEVRYPRRHWMSLRIWLIQHGTI